ncbi:MAG: hypothetical protein HG427_001695 [Flavobacteriaceae bacterium]|jgi:hypothetical protein|nr:hypothetical protein [Flavobacteriaceae bacterium]
MKYYIAYPAPIAEIVPEIEEAVFTTVEIHPKNNQVGIIETNLSVEELEHILSHYDVIIINDQIDEWI